MGGRQILDGVLIANEVIDCMKSSKSGGIILKVDFEKAYDCVNWDFLQFLLSRMGFGLKWISWIMECVSSALVSVLVNGSPTKEFRMKRGLRQGDPLSPFLFNMVVEGLHLMFEKALEVGLIDGICVGMNGLKISHLQFADDTIVFCLDDVSVVANVKRILCCFELVSGLKINFSKSSIIGVGISAERAIELARVIDCSVGCLPVNYLGFPLGANPRCVKTWDPVIKKVQSRLSSWKSRFLSFGGRITLLKASLGNVPLYYLSLFKAPKSVYEAINKI